MVAFAHPLTYLNMFVYFLRRMAESPHARISILTREVQRVLVPIAFPPLCP